jgi:isoquinoline 1-oxidoreductase beta subunit
LTDVAATLEIPSRSSVTLKDPADFALIGTSQMRVDEPYMVQGTAVFGIDVQVPGMLYAAVARSPVLGGKLAAFSTAEAEAIEGVVRVVEIENCLAVVAENSWAAIKGRDALDITWDEGSNGDLNSETIRLVLEEEIQSILPSVDNDGSTWVSATYEVPYLAHATMEPMNCTAHVREEDCSVWAPAQDAQGALAIAGSASQLPTQVHIPLIGCGLGRRLEEDYVREAVLVSKAMKAPIQVIWTREDDMRHGSYRPASLHILRARVDDQGQPSSWTHCIAGQSIGSRRDLEGGATGAPYRFSRTIKTTTPDLPVPTGYWRGVYNTQNGFANECFLDEFAEAAGKDPLELRLEIVNSRMAAVLELVAEKGNWGAPLPAGRGRGLACHTTWRMSDVAQVAEVSIDEEDNIRVHRVVCVIDCGIAINPDMVVSQMESGIIVGLTAALKGEITIANGQIKQSNFHDYPLLRMGEVPKIEVYIIPSGRDPGGVGEMGVPPIAPAVANALYSVTGSRVRKLPI